MAAFKGITESFIIKQKQEYQKQLFWPNLKNGPFNKFEDPISCVKYCQAASNFALASGFQVEIRDPAGSNAVLKSFHRFKSPVRSLAYSQDGNLLGVGESSGQLAVYSVALRTELRKMSAHTSAVSGLAFLHRGAAGSPRLASCAEDGRCLLWDVADPQGQPLAEFILPSSSGQQDAGAVAKATAIDASQADCNLFACGASNGVVALFDARQPRPALVVGHVGGADSDEDSGRPGVSAVRLAPGGNALYLAGDCWVRTVSLHQGGRQMAAYRRHHKLVTDLAVGRGALLSCGLDGLVKVTDLLTYEEVHKYEYPNSGLLCMALGGDASATEQDGGLGGGPACCLALGTSDRWLLTRRFEDPAVAPAAAKSAAATDPYLKLVRADRVMPARPEDSFEAPAGGGPAPGPRLHQVDKLLKSFRHSDALSHAMSRGDLRRRPQRCAALVRELARRGALATALAGRSDAQVARLLKFALHSLGSQELCADVLPLAWDLAELYAGQLRARPCLRGLFEKLRALLAREIRLGRGIMECLGRIDLVLGAASAGQGVDSGL